MSIQAEPTDNHQRIGSEIHPEIPMPAWASDRYLDDEGRALRDERSFDHGMFTIELGRSTSIESDGIFVHADDLTLWWTNVWPGEKGLDREYLTIFPKDIPALIEALHAAQAVHSTDTKIVRRSAEVEESLREREQ